MGRNRKPARSVERVKYDIFGNVIEEALPAQPAPPPPPPPAAPSESTFEMVLGNKESLTKVNDTIRQTGRIGTGVGFVDRKAKRESALLIDENGQVLNWIQGTGTRVSIPQNSTNSKAKIILHNHPEPVTLSPADLLFLYNTPANAIQAISRPFTPKEKRFLKELIPLMLPQLNVMINTGLLREEGFSAIDAYRECRKFLLLVERAVNENKSLTFTAAVEPQQKIEAVRVRLNMEIAWGGFFSRSPTVNGKTAAANLLVAVTEALIRSGQTPLKTVSTNGRQVVDQKSIQKWSNFMANLMGQHVALVSAASQTSAVSYGVSLD